MTYNGYISMIRREGNKIIASIILTILPTTKPLSPKKL